MTQPKPIFTHDCDACRFLGSVSYGNRWGDLYVCERNPNVEMRSVIYRTGSDGPEYSSVPTSMAPALSVTNPLRLAANLCAEDDTND